MDYRQTVLYRLVEEEEEEERKKENSAPAPVQRNQ